MSISLRGIQSSLENKIGELDSLKSHDWKLEFDVVADKEEKGTVKGEVNIINEPKWETEVQNLKRDISYLFNTFEKEIGLLSSEGINTDRYIALLQNLRHDYNNICNYIDYRKKRLTLFAKSNKISENKYQKLYLNDTESYERSQLYKEKNIIKESVSTINSIIDQALSTTQSLTNQKQTIKHIFDKTRTLRKKTLNNIQSVINSIINLQKKQNFVISMVFILLVIVVLYFKK